MNANRDVIVISAGSTFGASRELVRHVGGYDAAIALQREGRLPRVAVPPESVRQLIAAQEKRERKAAQRALSPTERRVQRHVEKHGCEGVICEARERMEQAAK